MRLNEAYFEGLFRGPIPPTCRALIEQHNWSYRVLPDPEERGILQYVTDQIRARNFSRVGVREKWENGWSEVRQNYQERANSFLALIPQYLLRNARLDLGEQLPLRFRRKYISTTDPLFELHWYEVFRRWVIETFLSDVTDVYEFGAGTCWNLVAMADLYPRKRYTALDWAQASIDIAYMLRERTAWNFDGRVFDLFNPDTSLHLPRDSAVLTVGALEQTGRDFWAFLDYLIREKPRRCVHIEPIVEWYNPGYELDQVAMRYHKARGYLQDFLAPLMRLERQGHIRILRAQRNFFGSLFIEGYSLVVWEFV